MPREFLGILIQKEGKKRMFKNVIEELQWRDLLYQQTDEEGLLDLAENGELVIYCGFDPTADSLHIGHLVPYMTLQRFLSHGHKVIVLVGGGTGRIGDPGGRSTERNLLSDEEILHNTEAIKKQITNILQTDNIIFVDNHEWLKDLTVFDFLRDYGKLFNINTMLSKESVQSRLETGLSFTEFSYPLLQSIDYMHLNKNFGCNVQLGGADQWGNIVSGVDMIRKMTDGEAKTFGMTLPLVTKADGTKFGKSVGGAVWLDPEKTSPYEMYQFWLNQQDADVLQYIKKFTFVGPEELSEFEKTIQEEPHLRKAQRFLADEVIKIVHGKEALEQVKTITEALFTGEVQKLSVKEVLSALQNGPTYELSDGGKILDVLNELNIVDSKRQGRELLNNGALRINGEVIKDEEYVIDEKQAMEGQLTVVRKGKKTYALIKHV